MSTIVTSISPVTVPVVGRDERFAVRRIYCVGRNYAAHVREMGFDPNREPPFFFAKPTDAIVVCLPGAGATINYPPRTEAFHFEIELVAAIGVAGKDIPVEKANEHIFGYAVGIDMTRRDLQIAARDKGRPWELGKGFDQSAPISALHAASDIGHPHEGEIWLRVDGKDRQRSDISKLIWSVPEIVSNLSTFFELQPGDLIYSGTPDGIGAVERGETMTGGVVGLTDIDVRVV